METGEEIKDAKVFYRKLKAFESQHPNAILKKSILVKLSHSI